MTGRGNGGATLADIAALCGVYADARARLAGVAGEIRAEQRRLARRRRRGLEARIAERDAAKAALAAAIEGAPALFERPRTVVIEGVKVGWRKNCGRIVCDDEARAVARIRKRLPEQADALIRVKESLDRSALKKLGGNALAAIGVSLTGAGDEIVIADATGDLDKAVKMLLEDGAETA